jgi:hypothetical protein
MKTNSLLTILLSTGLLFAGRVAAQTKSADTTTKPAADTTKAAADSTTTDSIAISKKDSAAAKTVDSLAKVKTKADLKVHIDSILAFSSTDVIARFEINKTIKVWKHADSADLRNYKFIRKSNLYRWNTDSLNALKAAAAPKPASKVATMVAPQPNPAKPAASVAGKKDTTAKDTSQRHPDIFKDPATGRLFIAYNPKGQYLIDKVHLLVKEGLLLEIETSVGTLKNTKGYVYRNKHTAIDLVHYEDQGNTLLEFTGIPYTRGGKDLFIFLDDVLAYYPLRSYSDIPYSDFDITMTPDSAHDHYDLKESSSLNSYFNVAAFTDIKGLSGEPNGVAQFQAEGKFITNTKTLGQGATVLFNYVAFEGGLSKYDSQFKGATVFHKDSVSRRELYQRSIYSVGLKLNLLRGFTSPKPIHPLSDWQLNIGYNFVGSKALDTTFKDAAHTVIDTSYRTITQNDFYIEPMVTLSRHQNFALSASLPIHFVSVKNDEKIKNTALQHWIAPTIELMYYARKDKNSKLFFRYRYLSNLDDHSQGYTQIQFGYSINLSSVWSPTPAN